MKLVWKILFGLVVLVVLVAGGFIAWFYFADIPSYPIPNITLNVKVTPERVERGRTIASMACRGCHLDYQTGKLTGKRLLDMPAEFGTAFSKNITRDTTYGIGNWTDGQLAVLFRTGIAKDGRYVPPWMIKLPRIADEDIYSIIAYLRSDDPEVLAAAVPNRDSKPSLLAKILVHTVFKPFNYPASTIVAPNVGKDSVAYGRYLVQDFLECYSCHSADFKTVNDLEPEKSEGYMGGGNPLLGIDGHTVNSANLTPDMETGIGKWSEDDFVKALRQGIRPDGRLLRYPMTRMPEFSETDVRAIYTYLRTVPPLNHPVDRNFPEITEEILTDGRAVFEKYGCIACHNADGTGLGNVKLAKRDFPADDQLRAWIENPSAFKPNTKMPSFRGIIKDAEFQPLINYLRTLASKSK